VRGRASVAGAVHTGGAIGPAAPSDPGNGQKCDVSDERPEVTALRKAIAGEVVARGDPGWDGARQAWNLTADQRPPVVVMAESPRDVAATVRFAAANGLRVAPQSTGHGATSMGDLAGTILLRTSRLTHVEVDVGQRTAVVQAGALWSDVIGLAARHGLVCLHGMSAAVGVAGHTLGGGIGWLARREGFAAGHVRAFEVVGADGEERRVDRASDPDLFWALRGGGGRPAIVRWGSSWSASVLRSLERRGQGPIGRRWRRRSDGGVVGRGSTARGCGCRWIGLVQRGRRSRWR
jgi:hypothetical protein